MNTSLRILSVLVFGFVGFAGMAHAQDSADQSVVKAKNPANTAQPTREDIDQEITNARLRAATGAKSLYSFQSAFNYYGSSVNTPLAQSRPQLSPGTVENDPAKLNGSLSGKYRATDHDNFNLGVGIAWLTPTYDGQSGQVEDPYVAYSRVFSAAGLQNVANVALQKYTARSAVKHNLTYESDLDYTVLYTVGKTPLQVGITGAWYHEFYSSDVGGAQEDTIGFYPFAEYSLNDRFSLRTVYRGLTYYSSQDESTTFIHDASTQSFGVGCSITRDIYLYPNVQWVWDDVRSEKTNVALSANINL